MGFRKYSGIGATVVLVSGCASGGTEAIETFGIESANLQSACVSATPTSGWVNGDIGSRTGRFRVQFDATPASANQDALFGLSNGPADGYTDLAAIQRFSTTGVIEARDGGSYAADAAVLYTPGTTRRFALDIDTGSHRYSLSQLGPYGYAEIASNFAFRSEQANTSTLDHFALKLDSGDGLGVCHVVVQEPERCSSAAPLAGFGNYAFSAQAVAFSAQFLVTPTASSMDAVIGFSESSAGAFSDLAAAVRFNPSGYIDVRKGGAYAADAVAPYSAGQTYEVAVIADVIAHSYSVFVDYRLVASNYPFRTEQSTVATLGNLATIVDSSSGTLELCGFSATPPFAAEYLHPTAPYGLATPWSLAPIDDGKLLIAEQHRVLTLDELGRVIATTPHGGSIQVDGAGRRYLFGTFSGSYDAGGGALVSSGGRDVYVAQFDASFQHVWSRRLGGSGDDTLSFSAVNTAGDVALRMGSELVRLDSSGADAGSFAVSPTAVLALGPSGQLFVAENSPADAGFSLAKLDTSGSTLWSERVEALEGSAALKHLASDAAGNAILAGGVNGTADFSAFGGPTRSGRSPEGPYLLIAKIDGAAHHVFSIATDALNSVAGLAVDGAGRTTVAGTRYNTYRYRLLQFEATGELRHDLMSPALLEPLIGGSGGAPVADHAGRVFWPFHATRAGTGISYLAKLDL